MNSSFNRAFTAALLLLAAIFFALPAHAQTTNLFFTEHLVDYNGTSVTDDSATCDTDATAPTCSDSDRWNFRYEMPLDATTVDDLTRSVNAGHNVTVKFTRWLQIQISGNATLDAVADTAIVLEDSNGYLTFFHEQQDGCGQDMPTPTCVSNILSNTQSVDITGLIAQMNPAGGDTLWVGSFVKYEATANSGSVLATFRYTDNPFAVYGPLLKYEHVP